MNQFVSLNMLKNTPAIIEGETISAED